MNFSKLSYGQIQNISSQLKSDADSMQKILEEVKNQFAKIGDGETWSGTAAASAKGSFDTLSAKFPDFYNAINDCSTYLVSVVENYQSVDAAVTGGK